MHKQPAEKGANQKVLKGKKKNGNSSEVVLAAAPVTTCSLCREGQRSDTLPSILIQRNRPTSAPSNTGGGSGATPAAPQYTPRTFPGPAGKQVYHELVFLGCRKNSMSWGCRCINSTHKCEVAFEQCDSCCVEEHEGSLQTVRRQIHSRMHDSMLSCKVSRISSHLGTVPHRALAEIQPHRGWVHQYLAEVKGSQITAFNFRLKVPSDALTQNHSDVEVKHKESQGAEDRAEAVAGGAFSQLRQTEFLEVIMMCLIWC